ncbi:hypothetical protein SUGI_0206700 [Cryptomeria japonica]|nr:hypothetical protein SUGI_0206700 [Cryptomeria japonica]
MEELQRLVGVLTSSVKQHGDRIVRTGHCHSNLILIFFHLKYKADALCFLNWRRSNRIQAGSRKDIETHFLWLWKASYPSWFSYKN